MAADEYFFNKAENKQISGMLRFYTWSPTAISIGTFFKKDKLNISLTANDNIKIVRRLTGGNAVLHNGDLTYSIILNKGIYDLNIKKEFYFFIANILQKTLNNLNITSLINTRKKDTINTPNCYNSISEYEISNVKGRKLIGSAQKILKNSMLQHGSFFYNTNPDEINKYLICNNNQKSNYYNKLDTDDDIIKDKFKESFNVYFDLQKYTLGPEDNNYIEQLIKSKYSKDGWNYKR